MQDKCVTEYNKIRINNQMDSSPLLSPSNRSGDALEFTAITDTQYRPRHRKIENQSFVLAQARPTSLLANTWYLPSSSRLAASARLQGCARRCDDNIPEQAFLVVGLGRRSWFVVLSFFVACREWREQAPEFPLFSINIVSVSRPGHG